MSRILDESKPNQRFFEEISKIPRKSFHEKAISDYIVQFAKERGLKYHQDEIGNVIIKKGAAQGYEAADTVMLQSHIDMVCEKEPGVTFDFLTDPINIYVEDGWLKAKGTTLGADDGAGVALMLGILDETEIRHPEIECVFTVQEEDGMGGALNLDYSQLKSKRLIALDGIQEGTTIVSTTGVSSGHLVMDIEMRDNESAAFSLKVQGLIGGHAALNIGKEQGNAIKIAARILYGIKRKFKINLVSITGGTIINGIPNECEAIFTCSQRDIESAKGAMISITKEIENNIRKELKDSDPSLSVLIEPAAEASAAIDDETSNSIIDLLYIIPVGTQTRSRKIADFPVASRNMGTISSDHKTLRIGCTCRAVSMTQVYDMLEQLKILSEKFGARYIEKFSYCGYTVDTDSPLIQTWAEVYKEESGKDLTYTYIHSGTDAGTIAERTGCQDIIVLMPNTMDVHSPKERMELSSFDRTYSYLKKILEKLK